jgi:hypothetical protein
MGYNKQLVCPAIFNYYYFKGKSDPELPMIRNYRKHSMCKLSFNCNLPSSNKTKKLVYEYQGTVRHKN